MIVFDLKCGGQGHVFEAWFRDGAAFEAQRKGRKIACPDCGDQRVKKAPMAPRIGKGAREELAVFLHRRHPRTTEGEDSGRRVPEPDSLGG